MSVIVADDPEANDAANAPPSSEAMVCSSADRLGFAYRE